MLIGFVSGALAASCSGLTAAVYHWLLVGVKVLRLASGHGDILQRNFSLSLRFQGERRRWLADCRLVEALSRPPNVTNPFKSAQRANKEGVHRIIGSTADSALVLRVNQKQYQHVSLSGLSRPGWDFAKERRLTAAHVEGQRVAGGLAEDTSAGVGWNLA